MRMKVYSELREEKEPELRDEIIAASDAGFSLALSMQDEVIDAAEATKQPLQFLLCFTVFYITGLSRLRDLKNSDVLEELLQAAKTQESENREGAH